MAREPAVTLKWIVAQVLTALADLHGRSLTLTTRLSDLGFAKTAGQLAKILNTLPAFQRLGVTLRAQDLANARTIGEVAARVYAQLRSRDVETPSERLPPASSPRTRGGRGKQAPPRRPPGKKAAVKKAKPKETVDRVQRVPRLDIRRDRFAGSAGVSIFRAFPGLPPSELRSRPTREKRPSRTGAVSPRKNRFANVTLLEADGRRRLRQQKSFTSGQVIRMRIHIGALSRTSQVENPIAVPEDKLPKDIDLGVMLSSTDFAVGVDEGSLSGGGTVTHGSLHLPPDGGPATTPSGSKYLYFFLKAPQRAPEKTTTVHARIGYYYTNILVQSQQLTADIGGRGRFRIVTDYTLSADLTRLERLPTRPRVSLFTNGNGGEHRIILRHPDTPPTGTDRGNIIDVDEATIAPTVAKLRGILSLNAPGEARRAKALLVNDLTQLAPVGWDLYTQIPGKLPSSVFDTLFEHPDDYVVQIGRPTSSAFVLPWAFMYDIPLNSGVKPTLCPMVEKWDGKTSLFAGSPRRCPCGPHAEDVLCPFGFWGVRYAIEQLSSSDDTVLTISAPPGSSFVVGEAQYDVNADLLAAHVAKLRDVLATNLPKSQLAEGKSRADIRALLSNDLPFVYFYCHGERTNVADPNTWLGVGNHETITAQDFIGWTTVWSRVAKRRVWSNVRPLIFINACHALAIEARTLVSYVDAFVGNGRAAGVIGTEVKVAQELAIDFAQRFYAVWLTGAATVEMALRAARMDYLRQGNMFGLVYTPYCWSDLKVVLPAVSSAA